VLFPLFLPFALIRCDSNTAFSSTAPQLRLD
jgi:hypothetical protein